MAQFADAPSLPPIVTVTGLHDSGKTTVVEALIGELSRRGLRVASIKIVSHDTLALQPEATDTRRHLAAGAEVVAALAACEAAVFTRPSPAGTLDELRRMIPRGIQWVVCEGRLEGVSSGPPGPLSFPVGTSGSSLTASGMS